jgi:ADP-ribose pyrophosphatase YjhB (NUDIX family)
MREVKANLDILKGEEVHVLNGVGKDAKVVGRVDRGIAEKFGFIHETANVVLITPSGKVLLQLRNKKNFDDHLAMYGGHLGVGESHASAVVEEMLQETGLQKLKSVPTFVGYEGYDRREDGDINAERRSWFVYKLDEDEYKSIRDKVSYTDRILGVNKSTTTRAQYKAALLKVQAGIIQESFFANVGLSDPQNVFSILVANNVLEKASEKDFTKWLNLTKKQEIRAVIEGERSQLGTMYKFPADFNEENVSALFPDSIKATVLDLLRTFRSGSGEIVGIYEKGFDEILRDSQHTDNSNPESPYTSGSTDNGFMTLDPEFYGQTSPVKAYYTPDSLDHLVSSQSLWSQIQQFANQAPRPNVGGIDLNEINVDRQGFQADIQFNPDALNGLLNMDIQGFEPVIINITPLPSVMPLLGLEPSREEENLRISQAYTTT